MFWVIRIMMSVPFPEYYLIRPNFMGILCEANPITPYFSPSILVGKERIQFSRHYQALCSLKYPAIVRESLQ